MTPPRIMLSPPNYGKHDGKSHYLLSSLGDCLIQIVSDMNLVDYLLTTTTIIFICTLIRTCFKQKKLQN